MVKRIDGKRFPGEFSKGEGCEMDSGHLAEFVYLAETLNFKQTAEHFFMSRSVISRHLAALEEAVGAKLIDRGGRIAKLTPEGEVFYRDARVILRDCDAAIEHVRAVQNENANVVRIGYLRNAARPVIVYFVRYIQEVHPGLLLELTCMEYGELRRAMEDGTVDIALAVNVSPEMSRHYRSTKIYTDRFFVVMSKQNPLAAQVGARGLSLSDIPRGKLLLPDSFVFSGLYEFIERQFAKQSQTMANEFYSDIDMLYLKVQTEDYVALSSGMNSAMFGDALRIVPIKDMDAKFTVSAFYRDGLDENAAVMCRFGFEACRDEIKKRGMASEPTRSVAKTSGFTFESFY